MESFANPDEFVGNLLSLQADSLALIALYDQDDVLPYANRSLRAAYNIPPDKQLSWSAIMRRNYEAGVGTVLKTANFDEWLVSTQSRRGKTAFRAFETDLVDGRWLWMTETVQPNGWMLCIASDITQLRADDRRLRQDRDLALRASHETASTWSRTKPAPGLVIIFRRESRRWPRSPMRARAGRAFRRRLPSCGCFRDLQQPGDGTWRQLPSGRRKAPAPFQ